ncbi:MAG: transposase [Candidatus Aminicenantales bacterium]
MEKISGWRHSGFSVHSKVRAQTRKEAERVGKYMIRPLLSLERLSFSEKEGKVCYLYGEGQEEMERKDYLELIAFLTDYSVVDRIINHLKLVFVASKPPPPQVAYQEVLMAAETSAEYLL